MKLLVILNFIFSTILCSEYGYTPKELAAATILSDLKNNEEPIKFVAPVAKRGRYVELFDDSDDYYRDDYIPNPVSGNDEEECRVNFSDFDDDEENWFASLESFRDRSTKKYREQDNDDEKEKENLELPKFGEFEPSTSDYSLNGYTAKEVANIKEFDAKDIPLKSSTSPRVSSNTATFLYQLGSYSVQHMNHFRKTSEN